MKLNKATRDTLVEALLIFGCEAAVSVLVALGFFIFGQFELAVIWGSLLGSAVVVVNYLILAISINRAVDKFMALRGDAEMDDEAAEKFAAENSASVTMAARGTYMLRMLLMIGIFVGAFVLNKVVGFTVFNVIATLVPLLAYRPVMYVIELVRSRLKREV
jgi:hypothetical protein